MYVLIVFNSYDDSDIDAVLGPFDSMQAASNRSRELFGGVYRRLVTIRVESELPDWAK